VIEDFLCVPNATHQPCFRVWYDVTSYGWQWFWTFWLF